MPPAATVKQLKMLIQEKTGISHRKQKIIQGPDVRKNEYIFEGDSDVTYIQKEAGNTPHRTASTPTGGMLRLFCVSTLYCKWRYEFFENKI